MNMKKMLSVLLVTAMLSGGVMAPVLAEEEAEAPIVKEEREAEAPREESHSEESRSEESHSEESHSEEKHAEEKSAEESQPEAKEEKAESEAVEEPSEKEEKHESESDSGSESHSAEEVTVDLPAEEPSGTQDEAPAPQTEDGETQTGGEEGQAPSDGGEESPAPSDEGEGDAQEPSDEQTPGDAPQETEEPADPEVEETPAPSEVPEETPAPQAAEVHISATGSDVTVGQQAGFHFDISHAAQVTFRLVAPDGSTVASGNGGNGSGDYTFVPEMGGSYTMSVIVISEDGSEVSASASLTAVALEELTLYVKADAPCCHGGDSVSFTIELPGDVEIAECSINAYQSGSEFYHSSQFADKVTVTPPARSDVTKVTLSVSVTDVKGRSAEASVTIPCAVHDEESRAQWEATMSGVTLTGVWPDDLLAIARTQIGYVESSKDFGKKDDGGISGYTRYGDWAGMPYEEWCAMFASFCLNYAGVPEESFPRASNQQRWIRKLEEKDLYALRGAYEPQVGDLVFFDWDGDNKSDHVGIVESLETDSHGVTGITTIEGNSKGGAVTSGEYYAANDWQIMGYGLVNLAYERELASRAVTLTAGYDGVVVTVQASANAGLPEGAALVVGEIGRGDGYEELAARLAKVLDDDALTYARFLELGFADADGAAIWPAEAVNVTIDYAEKISGDSSMRPGVAFMDKRVHVSREVNFQNQGGVSSFAFEQGDFDGVIATFTTGILKCRKGSLSASASGDIRAQLRYAATAGVPDGSALTVREISPKTGMLDQLGDLPEGATVRFFELGLTRNGIDYNIDDTAELELTCRQSASGARVVCLEDGSAPHADAVKRSNGHYAVRFNTPTLGVIAVIYE